MAKKKKSQLKPVARGFATQSMPKKVTEVQAEEKQTEDASSSSEPNVVNADVALLSTDVQGMAAERHKVESDEYDPAKVEEQSLQNLIDKFQERTEKEIMRNIKIIEQERRFSDTLSSVELDPFYVDRILDLAQDTSQEGCALDEPEDKVIPRLAITYGILRRLGFTAEITEECLRSIRGIDIDEALDWLHVHLPDELLRGRNSCLTPATSQWTSSASVQGPLTPMTPHTPTFALNANAPLFVPPAIPSVSSSRDEIAYIPSFESSLAMDSPVLKTDDSMPQKPIISEEYLTDDPNSSYVRLKMQIDDLTVHRAAKETRDHNFLKTLQRRLEEVKRDYLFDEAEAEAAYRVEREKVKSSALFARLRLDSSPIPSSPPATPPNAPTKPIPSAVPEPSAVHPGSIAVDDIFEEDEDGPGGMFGLLETMPTSETTETGTVVQIREMPLPKHWSGRTPRILLADAVKKLDKHADIEYDIISGSSRAKRAVVRIRNQGRFREWSMEDVACHDSAQAEQYVATLALHALTFPPTKGFAVGQTSAAGGQTFFRLLPAVYRDLWDELEEKRHVQDDATNRSVWAELRGILEEKSARRRETRRETRQATNSRAKTISRKTYRNSPEDEQVMEIFNARRISPEYQEMLHQRNALPIAAYRNEIVATLKKSQVLVLSGETGCGKSTQVPSFLLEDCLSRGQSCKIYCTEPRRISAISLASRVSQELGEPAGAVGTLGSLVGYSIRLESNTSKTTRLAFVTNGIALRMLEGGSGPDGQTTAFDEITHIVIDEVHERTIESDFLLIVLKSLVKQRPDLKVILMSATLNAEKISNYFDGCPVFQVPGRTFPVEVCYLEDAIELTQWKVAEGSPYAIRGNDKYSRNKARNDWSEDTAPADDDDEEAVQEDVKLEKQYSSNTTTTINRLDERLVPYELIILLLERLCLQDSPYTSFSSAVLIFMPGMREIRRMHELLMEHPQFSSGNGFRIYPLHSTIASDQQAAVFDIPPKGVRKIVIATNIAETGITIPDITCVIDTGRQREMRFDEKRQLSRLLDTFVARSNAAQRRGRAGRVQPGLCFHLFTKARYDGKMAEHPDPEMMRLSLSDLALRIKIMNIRLGDSIEDVLSRALDPPSLVNIQRAILALVEVRALTPSEEITPMGRLLSKMPTDVHLGKFLLVASLFHCLDPALTIAATLSSKSPFLTPFGKEDEAARQKMTFRTENSDFLTVHNAFCSWRRACANGPHAARKLCRTAFLSHQNLQQIEELRQQLLGYLVDSGFLQVDRASIQELHRVRYGRGRFRFVPVPPELDYNAGNSSLVHAALCAGLYPKILSVERGKDGKDKLVTITNNQAVAFHPSSINFGRKPRDFGVNNLCYFTIMQSKKMYAWETGPVDDLALLLLCGDAEFKLASDSVFIDKKIKFRAEPKTFIALKLLRDHLSFLLATQFRGKLLLERQTLWDDLSKMVLGKVKPIEQAEPRQEIVTLVVNRQIP